MRRRLVLRLIVGILTLAGLARPASAQRGPTGPTEQELRNEIAQLQKDIDPLLTGRLGDPASVRVDLSAAPISRVFSYVNGLPPKQREVSFDMSSVAGGIAHWEGECKIWFVSIGSIGAWAFFEDVSGGGFWLTLQRAAASWNAGQGALDLNVDVSGYAFIPTIHTSVKPICFIPRFGGPDIGPIGVTLTAHSASSVKLSRGTSQLFTVTAPLNVSGSLKACTHIIIFGDLCLPFDFSGHFDWIGEVGGPVQQDGEVIIPIGNTVVKKKFTIDLANRTPSTTSTGFRVVVAPVIVWH